MRSGLFQTMFAASFAFFTFLQTPARAQQVTHTYKGMETELMRLVNVYRDSIGAVPLKQNVYLSNIAERHSRNMATKKLPYGNDGFKDRTEKIYEQFKPVYSFAENIDSGKVTPKEIIDEWLNSPKHRKNMRGDYNYSGIGIVRDADSVFFITQIFILKGN